MQACRLVFARIYCDKEKAIQNIRVWLSHPDEKCLFEECQTEIFTIGGVVRFSLGTSLWYRDSELFCNHPLNDSDDFERRTFHLYEWLHSDKSNDSTCVNVTFTKAGMYN